MEAQVKLIRETYKRAGLDIAETGYVEAHVSRILLPGDEILEPLLVNGDIYTAKGNVYIKLPFS